MIIKELKFIKQIKFINIFLVINYKNYALSFIYHMGSAIIIM